MTNLPVWQYINGSSYQDQALYVAPPEATTWSADGLSCAVDFSVPQVPFMLPRDLTVKLLPTWIPLGAPAITLKTMWINTNLPCLPGETLVHECVHHFQRQRMGAVSYNATFAWHIVLNFGSHGIHWHDTHEMEREARRIAREVITKCYVRGTPLDIEKSIRLVTGW